MSDLALGHQFDANGFCIFCDRPIGFLMQNSRACPKAPRDNVSKITDTALPPTAPPVSIKAHEFSTEEITGGNAPLVWELKAPHPTPKETIAGYILGFAYRDDMDEFSKHELLQKIQHQIQQRIATIKPEQSYSVSEELRLSEYDFNKNAFPTRNNSGEEIHGQSKYFSIPNQANGSSQISHTYYKVSFTNGRALQFIPVPFDQAKALTLTLQKSRNARITYTGVLDKCEEEVQGKSPGGPQPYSTKIIYLKVSEIALTLNSGQRVSYKIPNDVTALAGKDKSAADVIPVAKPVQRSTPSAPQLESPENTAAAPPIYVVVGVTPGDFLNVRSEPAMNSDAVFKLTNGDKVQVTGQSAFNGDTEWIPITANSQKGWVRNKYLRLQSK